MEKLQVWNVIVTMLTEKLTDNVLKSEIAECAWDLLDPTGTLEGNEQKELFDLFNECYDALALKMAQAINPV